MSYIVLSETSLPRILFAAIDLIHRASLFTEADLAHLAYCETEVDKYFADEEGDPCLSVSIMVHFKNWSYSDHEPSTDPVDGVPAEVYFNFEQDQDGKLTGKVEGGFMGDDPALVLQLGYVKGW